jgi:photosynthetic reaction center cytochrome c subunit
VLPAGGARAGTAFKNLQVLGDLDVNQFTGLMVALTAWVSPQQGCGYCHVPGDLASDGVYTKVVARRMLQMTQQINSQWVSHLAGASKGAGVTCFTCHRGQPVPANIWFTDPGPKTVPGALGNRRGQNAPAPAVGYSALPYDPLTAFLSQANDIRVTPMTALPTKSHPATLVQAEQTYGLMTYISRSLGVNCNYCHNSQSFASWPLSTPQRTSAWTMIRMVRELNNNYLEPLKSVFPANRLGPLGDVPKIGCATCHQGAYRPLYGAPILKDYPILAAAPAAKK